jgi:predicted aconitase
LLDLLQDSRIHPEVAFYVNTSRFVQGELEKRGWLGQLEGLGVKLVLDTCTYVAPIMGPQTGAVMTSSAKCAYYAPGNLGVRVAFGSTAECVRSATIGRVWRDEGIWA